MGRRKERRLAATGRRVKLDLLAEPSEKLGEADEVEGDGASKSNAGLPNSPSSSGQRAENPLLLLEQYSDDELDKDLTEEHNNGVGNVTSNDVDDLDKISAGEQTEDVRSNDEKQPSNAEVDRLVMDHGSISQDSPEQLPEAASTGGDLNQGTEPKEACLSAPDVQHVGDVTSGWKTVLHEESNQYYYWNILTGETSWEVPDVLGLAADAASLEQTAAGTEGEKKAADPICEQSTPDIEHDSTRNQLSAGFEAVEVASDGSEQGKALTELSETCKVGSCVSISLLHGVEVSANVKTNDARHTGEYENRTSYSSQLLKHCENLLERLRTVQGLSSPEGREIILKYTWEVEIRLADIKALASHRSSLLPFWMHSEIQLKQLEAYIDEVIQNYNSAPLGKVEAANRSPEGTGDGNIDYDRKKAFFPAGMSHDPENSAQKSSLGTHGNGALTTTDAPSIEYPTAYSDNNVRGKGEVDILSSDEEVDMDVDMEVDDTSLTTKSTVKDAVGAQYHVPSGEPSLSNPPIDQGSSVPGETFSVPPPPDEEWIPPPPPPDNDESIPPPPDEPPETSYPQPSYLEAVQPSYIEQYNLAYPGSTLQYYGQTEMGVSSATLYTHPDGSQVAVSHIPHYYDAASNMYSVAPLVVNSVESTAYYGLQSGTTNLSGMAVQSSGIHHGSVPQFGTDTVGSVDGNAETGAILLPEIKIDHPNVSQENVKASSEMPSTEAPVITFGTSVSVSSTSDASTAAPIASAAAKVQPKVSRNKKRNVAAVSSLRSNKKVSSLVDKWKAAKEELQEEEEEPENAYELLERKRQREIEEWRAQQIASGEAKENANFQPLGGDWRERVKRRRAQKNKEAEQDISDVTVGEPQQPDTVELSKGLPSGWQAYWDESSKQVYYGNTLTSETTWIRPSD